MMYRQCSHERRSFCEAGPSPRRIQLWPADRRAVSTSASSPRRLITFALALGFALAVGAAPASPQSAAADTADAASAAQGRSARPGEMRGGRKLYLECRGSGGPTVILVPGLGNAGDVWSHVDPGVRGPA